MANDCTILLFAHAADVVGKHELSLQLSDDATVTAAMDALCEQFPQLAPMRSSFAVAVNEKYARMEDIIPKAATIAVIPPVSGG